MFDDIELDLSKPRSVTYAICRNKIEKEATNREERRKYKQIVIEFLGGVVHPSREYKTKKHGEYVTKTLRAFVEFPDRTKAVL